MIDKIIGGQYKITKKIGAGSFGVIFEGEDIKTKDKIALKIENKKVRYQQLGFESKLYMLFSGGINVPRLKYYQEDKKNNIMVMDLMGKSLEDLHTLCGEKMSLKTVLMLAEQMISSVEYLHNKYFIHRDIKPDNFVMGLGNHQNQLFILDFGLCKRYRDSTTHEHIPYQEGKDLTGTARYASVNSLKGCEVSRRDDMESLGYIWIYLLKGSLPWMGLEAKDKISKYKRIYEVKEKTTPDELCAGYPSEFAEYLKMVKKLEFTETPQYSLYRKMFRDLFIKKGFKYDYQYDWLKPPSQGKKKTKSAKVSPPHVKKIMPKQRSKSPKNSLKKKPKKDRKNDSNTTEKETTRSAPKADSEEKPIYLEVAKSESELPTVPTPEIVLPSKKETKKNSSKKKGKAKRRNSAAIVSSSKISRPSILVE